MAENTKRSLFGFHGLFGFIISIFGLLFIMLVLVSEAIITQQHSAQKPYDPAPIRDVNNIKMKTTENFNYAFPEPKKDK